MPKEIPLATVKQHNKPNDLWVIIEDKVYDLSKFRSEHPGGEEVLVDVAGSDGTKSFIDVGHSADAKTMMAKYYIGDLASKDRKSKLPLREIGICVVSFVIGVAAVILIKQLLIKK